MYVSTSVLFALMPPTLPFVRLKDLGKLDPAPL
jgi:hypothetical protein